MKCRQQYHMLLTLLGISFTWTLARPDLQFNANFIEQVLRNVNDSVEPCEDFYSYACGNWSENYKDTHNYLDMPGYMDYKFNTQLLRVLEMNHQQGGIYNKLWAYYVSCRDLTEPDLNEFLFLLEPTLQLEWPIFKNNHSAIWRNETQFDWLATLAKLRSFGFNAAFIRQDVNVRRENGSHYVILLKPQAVDATLFIEENILDLYLAFGVDALVAKNLTDKLMQLEWQLGNLTSQMELNVMGNLSEWTLQELQQRLPQVDWSHYLANVLEQPPDALQLFQVSLLNENYLQQLQVILNQSSNETICYYLMFKLLYVLNEELPVGAVEARSMACLVQLRGHMPLAMHYLYEAHYYGKQREEKDAALQRLQRKLIGEFERLLQQNHLQLNAEEQAYVLDELHGLRLKIGNMPLRLTMQQLLLYYKDLQLQDNDFYGNKLQLLQFHQRREHQLLDNKPTWDYYHQDAVVASSSSPVKIFQNAVLLPHGYLQLPLYDTRFSELLQHAQLGFILAHELQHAFDLFHIVYDARGNYNTTGLAVLQHFANFTNCYTSVHNVEEQLLSESMSDIVGLRLAFASYFDNVQNDDRPRHDKHTQQQLFFINSVQFLCANMQQIRAVSITEDVEHGMHNERVNRNWPHHEHFAKAFNCTVGQAMYQPQTCRLW